MEITYRILDIIRGTTVDGPGFRTAIYFSGCRHQCRGCHNPQSWDPENGHEMTVKDIMKIVDEEDFDVTFSGGDPLFDPLSIIPLLEELKKSNRNIWIYTGYTWEDILENSKLLQAVKLADVVVDGPFVVELKDPDLRFHGSSNQRIIKVKESLDSGSIVYWE